MHQYYIEYALNPHRNTVHVCISVRFNEIACNKLYYNNIMDKKLDRYSVRRGLHMLRNIMFP